MMNATSLVGKLEDVVVGDRPVGEVGLGSRPGLKVVVVILGGFLSKGENGSAGIGTSGSIPKVQR